MNSGISSRQGGHHVAQKLRSTTLPRHPAVEMKFPSRSFTRNGGTGLALLAKRMISCPPVREPASPSTELARGTLAELAVAADFFLGAVWLTRTSAIARPTSPTSPATRTSNEDFLIATPMPVYYASRNRGGQEMSMAARKNVPSKELAIVIKADRAVVAPKRDGFPN